MTIKEFREIAKHNATKTAPVNFDNNSVRSAFMDGIKELAGTYNQFMKNRYDLYDIVIETADDITPRKVIDELGAFCEVRVVPDGQQVMFKKRKGRDRAKQFITAVGINGVYETFRLDTETFDVKTHAVGGAGTVDFQRVVDGYEDMADIMDILTEGLTDAAYYEVHRALRAAIDAASRPEANVYSNNGFNPSEMLKLINVVRAYGTGVVIFATPEFVAAMGPDAIVAPITGVAHGIYSPDDIESIHRTGRIKIFRGATIVEIAQSFTDESNTTTWIDPQMAYIFPTGGEKIVKLVIEGPTRIRDYENRDGSMEVHMERKLGAAILTHNNWAIYQNTGIPQTYKNPYGFN